MKPLPDYWLQWEMIAKQGHRRLSAEELAACEANNSPDVVVRAIRENKINGATLNELDEATIESIGKTLLEKKQLLGEYHKCMPQTITLPPLIKSPQKENIQMRAQSFPRLEQ